MNHKTMLLPRMAANNIRKNGSTYFPFIGVSIFAVFTYFVFDLILQCDVTQSIPRAQYALILLTIGFALLGVIMVPFLYYTNSFLIKRRKRELGIYSILGLEKKHIGIMMFWESLVIYVVVMAAALILGLIFSKLIFLVLLNLSNLPVEVDFTISGRAIVDALVFYAFITGLNLLVNLFQVGKSNPVELMSGSAKGEKEPKHIILWSLVGILFMAGGYYMAITAQMDSMLFVFFFLAVLFVMVGTYYLFTAGSIAILRILKKNKKSYYKSDNFITVSGMLYRMKKNAASLANICVFATMVIITVICTLTVYLDMDKIISFMYPSHYQVMYFGGRMQDHDKLLRELEMRAANNNVELENEQMYCYTNIGVTLTGNEMRFTQKEDPYRSRFYVQLLTLEEYNLLQGAQETLLPSEVLIFSTGADFGNESLLFGGNEYQVKRELMESAIGRKDKNNLYNCFFTVIFADENSLAKAASAFGINAAENRTLQCRFDLEGTDADKESFYNSLFSLEGVNDYASVQENSGSMEEIESMYGGLLFIGIFFGLIFLICLLIIMYYKQITEGYEDQKNFDIMQKVGMSDVEIRRTIRKQILLVFSLPLVGAICHTLVAIQMVNLLMSAIWMFDEKLLIGCTLGVILLFTLFYIFCYRSTARAYFSIVHGAQKSVKQPE